MFQVFRISTAQKARIDACSVMLRHGSILEILTSEGHDYLAKAKPIFMQGIVDRSYTCYPYYVGLIEAKTMANAKLEDLHRWFQGMTVYVRESQEDKGVLIASAVPLGDIFQTDGRFARRCWLDFLKMSAMLPSSSIRVLEQAGWKLEVVCPPFYLAALARHWLDGQLTTMYVHG